MDKESPESIQLNKPVLLGLLNGLRAAGSLSVLRQGVGDLLAQIASPDSPLRAPAPAETVVFPRAYALEELEQILAAQTLERARYYLERFIKSIAEVKTNPINDLNLNRWKEYEDIYTDSLWIIDRRDSSGAHTADYWGNFIPQIPYQMLRRYTKKGEWVLDPFAGSGTTLIEAQRLGRHSIGVELQPQVAEWAQRLIASEPNRHGVVSEVVIGDSTCIDYRAILQRHGQQSVQLVIMHPPYFDIIAFSDDPRDLSNAASVDNFLALIGRAIDNVAPVLDPGRYLALVIGDKYAHGEWIPLGFWTMNEVLKRGFALKSIIVKNFEATTGKRSQKELWKYRALAGGFYIFKHEYIFVFRKR
jgi:DNA modification methylase